MQKRFLYILLICSSWCACSTVNDCQCTISDEKGQTTDAIYYDEEGSCSNLEEEGVTCKEI